jgi:TonB family protein
MHPISRAVLVASLALAPAALAAQAPPPRCAVVPDTVPAPSPQQVREADEMREQLRAILRAHGQPEQGLLMVDVDANRRGRLLFMEADIPDTTRAVLLAHVAGYLGTLAGGQGYQALVRMDATYPAVAPGMRQCRPEMVTYSEYHDLLMGVQVKHPAAGRHGDRPLRQRATVLLVVTRDGAVAHAELIAPTGDEYLDASTVDIVRELRFEPASLDDVPIDVRLRFPVSFSIR